MLNQLSWVLLGVALSGLAGCCASTLPTLAPQTSRLTISGPAATQDASAGTYETYRVADPADLRLSIYGLRPAARGFPYVLLTVQNVSSHDVIVSYERGSLEVHCGPYVQRGPEIFERKRQILSPRGTIVFDPPQDSWGEASSGDSPELMIPIKVPAGRYTVQATFRVLGVQGGLIQSDTRDYDAK